MLTSCEQIFIGVANICGIKTVQEILAGWWNLFGINIIQILRTDMILKRLWMIRGGTLKCMYARHLDLELC